MRRILTVFCFQLTPQLLMASQRIDKAMKELAKANNSIAKLGSDAIARAAILAEA